MRTEGRLSERITPALEPATPACRRTSALPFVKSSPLCLSATPFRRMVWNPDGCDKHRQFNRPCGKTRGRKGVDTLKVRDAMDVEQAVRAADSQRAAAGNHRPWLQAADRSARWRPMRLLDLSALNAVTSYEPTELIITVQGGRAARRRQVAD